MIASFIYSFIYCFIYLFIYLLLHLFIYLFIASFRVNNLFRREIILEKSNPITYLEKLSELCKLYAIKNQGSINQSINQSIFCIRSSVNVLALRKLEPVIIYSTTFPISISNLNRNNITEE